MTLEARGVFALPLSRSPPLGVARRLRLALPGNVGWTLCLVWIELRLEW